MSDTPPKVPLRDIFRVFFTVGASSFGGGVTGWMHRITVDQRGWLTNEKFLAGLALGQVLPGANVTNMAVYIGQQLRGALGALVALVAVLMGPFFLVIAVATLYDEAIKIPGFHSAMDGIAAAAVGMVLPHLGVDPVPAAAALVQGFQTIISRNMKPIDTGVISVTMIHTGQATNVIPETCEMQGTVRTFTTELLDMIETRMKAMSEATAAAYDCSCEFQFTRNYPPTINHDAETAFAQQVLGEVVGPENVLPFEPTMGSEDFSYYLLEKPGCYFMIGNGDGAHREGGHGLGPCMLHNPSYDFNDDLIPLGATAWVRMAEQWLATPR